MIYALLEVYWSGLCRLEALMAKEKPVASPRSVMASETLGYMYGRRTDWSESGGCCVRDVVSDCIVRVALNEEGMIGSGAALHNGPPRSLNR